MHRLRSIVRHARLPLSLSLALLAGVACKPGAQDMCERYAKAQCRFQYGCCNAAERQEVQQGLTFTHHNEETCVEELTKAICAAFATYSDAEQQGRVIWDHEVAGACLGEMESAAGSCDAETLLNGGGLSDECNIDAFATGAVEDDGTCYQTFECANEEAVCVPNEAEDEDEVLVSAKGTCTPPPGVGDECPDFVCAESAWCDLREDPPTCKASKPNGEPCDSALECDSGVCSFATGAGECAAKKPDGSPCFSDLECASEFCDEVAGACDAKRPVGEPCVDNAACTSDYCNAAIGECALLGDDVDITYDICSATEQ